MADMTSTTSVADVRALADRVQRGATTTRQLDWPALQEDLVLGARFMRSLSRASEAGETEDIRALAERIAAAGAATKRPDWEPLQEQMVAAAARLHELTAAMNATDAISIGE